MKVVVEKQAAKYLENLNEIVQRRIYEALEGLSQNPPSGDIVKLQGQNGYRRRVGDLRIIFDISEREVIVYKIAPRGQAYN